MKTTSSSIWFWDLALAIPFAVVGALSYSNNCVVAQLAPDTTLGSESSVVKPLNPSVDQIEGGAIRGTNLFHSFQEFNVSEGRGVYFTKPAGIENIFSRVTGGNSSNIVGKLGVLGNVHLFLINPNGIIFGAKASLDVGGSFLATTTNSIQFGNQGFFSASAPNVPPVLTINPSALVFNQAIARSIINNSTEPAGQRLDPSPSNSLRTRSLFGLQVPEGRSLLLVGGNVNLNGGGLNALGGRVELGGVASSGTVGLNVNGNNLSLSFPDGVAQADISLTNGARVDTSGEGSGNIQVQGKRITLNSGSQIVADTLGSKPGGSIIINSSDSVYLIGRTPRGILSSRTLSAGNSGDLTVNTRKFVVQGGAQVLTSTNGKGSGGKLTVNASESVELSGENSSLSSATSATGDAGDLKIATRNLTVQNGAEVAVSSQGAGNAGNIEVTTRSIHLDKVGKLTATSALGTGGGNITLKDLNLLLLRGNSEISTEAGGAGNGGDITIGTDLLAATESSNIRANAFEGQGGNIRITTQGLFLSLNSEITASSERGIDGVVKINRPSIDPSAELVILSAQPVDISGLIAQGCSANGSSVTRELSEFVVTGNGGLPPNPEEALRSDSALADLGTPVHTQGNFARAVAISSNSISTLPAPLVEAQGWVLDEKGQVILTASAPTVTLDIPWLRPTTCHGS